MIGWLEDAVTAELLTPQTLETVDVDRRCALLVTDEDPTGLPVTADAQLSLLPSTTEPVSESIGGGAVLRHTITVSLAVTDGDELRGRGRRDGIVTDLVMRLLADRTLGQPASPDGAQELTEPVRWSVDYTPLGTGLPAMYAVVTLTADVDLSPQRAR